MTAPTTRETADHIGEANEKVTADHAELARLLRLKAHIENLKCRPGHHVQFGTPSVVQVQNYWNRDLAADLLALLSEIAALREERDEQEATKLAAYDRLSVEILDRDQAERQRDALRKALPDLSNVIAWLDNGCEPKHAVTELAIYKARIDQILANQGADQ